MDPYDGTFADCQVRMPGAGLLYRGSPQLLLAKKMILIVTQFGSKVVEFIFGGRNSGQGRGKSSWILNFLSRSGARKRSILEMPIGG